MFELIQKLMSNNHPDIHLKVSEYIQQNKPYFLSLIEFKMIKNLVRYENLTVSVLFVINHLLNDRKKIKMDEELFCKYIKKEAKRNTEYPILTIEYNLEMFHFIQFYAHKYGIDPVNLVNMVIPEYVKHVDRIYKDSSFKLIYPQ